MSARYALEPLVQNIVLAAAMPAHLDCRLLTLDAPRDQLRIHTRSLLRELLAGRLNIPAQQLDLLTSASGRLICPQATAAGLTFSLSYAPPHACLVLGQGSHMGIDIERIVSSEPTWNLLEHVFTEAELQQWLRIPDDESRRRAFTAAWAVKEAVLKARGTGLAEPPQSVSITISADGQIRPATATPGTWQQLDLIPGYAGALVLSG